MSLFEELCFGKPLKKTHKRTQSVICAERDLVSDLDKVNRPDDNSAPPVPKTYIDTPEAYYELINKHVEDGDFIWTCETDLFEACERPHVDEPASSSADSCDRDHLDDHACAQPDPLEPFKLLGLAIAFGGESDYVAYPYSSDLVGELCLSKGVLSWRGDGLDWITLHKGLSPVLSRYLYFE